MLTRPPIISYTGHISFFSAGRVTKQFAAEYLAALSIIVGYFSIKKKPCQNLFITKAFAM